MKLIIVSLLSLLLLSLAVFLSHEAPKPSINPNNASSNSELTEKGSFTLLTTGDIGLVRFINYQIQERDDPRYPFLEIAEYLNNADLTITNLEGPLIENCPIVVTGFKFCGKDTNVEGLVYSGVDAASLANNHTTNYGIPGLEETKSVLSVNGIIPFGTNESIEYINIKDHRIALVGFVELGSEWGSLNNATRSNIINLVNEANKNANVVITSFHWGVEYTHTPTQNQERLARMAIDNGADIVLGNHPHWIQPIEKYKNKYIVYAQGNTVFDQDWSQKTKEGVLYKFEFNNGKFALIDEKFTIIENNSQPRFANEEESRRIKSDLSF